MNLLAKTAVPLLKYSTTLPLPCLPHHLIGPEPSIGPREIHRSITLVHKKSAKYREEKHNLLEEAQKHEVWGIYFIFQILYISVRTQERAR